MIELNYFTLDEFSCSHTGENAMDPDFLVKLDNLRHACGFPFVITSGYRSPSHFIEARKSSPGSHSQGIAADIKITSGQQRYQVVTEALKLGFTGIGVDKGFVHVDTRTTTPVMWTY